MNLIESRPDAGRVHSEDDINIHRTFAMIVFNEQFAEILWVGNHQEYDATFKGNKKTIENWLRNHGKIK
ncbi:MAG: type II toxin-antitoxin system HigB family toxin [Ichthyobacteriaceae bacterium]|nr:type II toxin-antitoxin system HigB family toxin [Ichthyobacteriaceae bacterium]